MYHDVIMDICKLARALLQEWDWHLMYHDVIKNVCL